jgi:NAD(P)-dependent dehydrogenase (short-subunit alcohol dehydrogenase family)
MKEFKDKVAVITGAAAGIGRGIAERCAAEGMRVVLAGINESTLAKVEQKLLSEGATVLSVRTDVSKREDVETLAEETLRSFGAIDLLVNNAGVGAGPSIWESTWEDWEWVVGVNLWSVIYGLKIFVPIMLSQDTEGYIINTASMAGLLPYHPSAPYQVTKHAVVALTEQLHYSLMARNAKIRAAVLCPGWVKTRILESERNRPVEFQNETVMEKLTLEQEAVLKQLQGSLEAGISVEKVVERVFNAMEEEKFYILTHPEYKPLVKARVDSILQGLNPPPLPK